MSKPSPFLMSAARRKAEAALNRQRHDSVKDEQQLAHDAMAEKTARLRALRLAKEAAEKDAAMTAPAAEKPPRVRRSKQT